MDLAKIFDAKNILFSNISDHEKKISIYLFQVTEWIQHTHQFSKMLQAEELETANRFKHDKDKLVYIVRHGLLRMLLSKVTGASPQLIKLTTKRFQKPRLLFPSIKDLDFNSSASGRYFVVAVSFSTQVGIDVQKVSYSDNRITGIAEQFFHREEVDAIKKEVVEEKMNAFFQLWTTKEAFVKLSQNFQPETFAVPLVSSAHPISKKRIGGFNLCFHCLEIDPDYKATVIYRI